MPAARRTPLTRARALAEAVALADEQGLDAVSMRTLAARLGVVPMALYRHVTGKEDLVSGMVDVVVEGYAVPAPSLGWKASVRAHVLAARAALAEHPWARRAVEASTTRTPPVLAHMDRVTGAFLGGGLSPALTHRAMHTLGHRLWGFSPEAFQEAGDDTDDAAPPTPPPPEVLERLREAYPHIAAVSLDAVDGDLTRLGAGCDEDAEFVFALDLLLDGVERLHERGWSPR